MKMSEIQENAGDYARMKTHLFVRLLNPAMWDLEDLPHRETADLYLVCAGLVEEAGEIRGCFPVTRDLLSRWNITEERLFADAMENSAALLPARTDSLGKMVGLLPGTDSATAVVVTNSRIFSGASALLYPGMAEEMAEVLGDFLVLPSSIHETILMPCEEAGDRIGELEEMVRCINRMQVAPEDRLSDHVYVYRASSGKLTRAV